YLDNFNPATAEVYSSIPDSDERDVEAAVEAAKRAFPLWSKTSTDERFEILMRLVRLIERDLDELAEVESVDNGK
ncbi:MAG TPA: aldehyde dehydrogenase family protein, partial [Pyrinomonadaceae bacterium]|nr:aldehyde dehydrogenase family protein [Pyrinomonadaceae bacterium]